MQIFGAGSLKVILSLNAAIYSPLGRDIQNCGGLFRVSTMIQFFWQDDLVNVWV
jgi:hypothetical protein